MSYYRKCEDCGCTLDPGEGRICDECAEKMRQKTDRMAVLRKMILSTNYKQMEMEEYLR